MKRATVLLCAISMVACSKVPDPWTLQTESIILPGKFASVAVANGFADNYEGCIALAEGMRMRAVTLGAAYPVAVRCVPGVADSDY